MFIRRIKRANGQVGIVLVEGYRDNGKVKQRTVEYLGTESDLTKDDPEAVNKLIEKYKNEQNKKEAFIKLTLNLAEKIPTKNTVRNYGYFYLEKMFQELGLNQICEEIVASTKIQYSLKDCLELLCLMRALNPKSKKSSLEKGFDYFIDDYDLKLEQIYKSLTLLQENKEKIVSRMHEALCQKFQRKTEILHYDVTNYFFEIDEVDEFRKNGCSKEHRPNPIVQMGLFIDNQGLPVDFYLYEGNKPDCTTMKPSFDQIKKRYNTGKVIITADKGLNSASNLGYILSENNGYIVSQKIRGAKNDLQAMVLSSDGWKSNNDGSFRFKDFIRQINITYPNGEKHLHQQKVVCIWSEKYQIKEKATRDNLLDKIATLASDPNKFKQSCHTGMKKYIDEVTVDKNTGEENHDVAIQTSLNQNKITNDESLDGYYLIVTSEIGLSISEVIAKYRGLWRIEESFRVTKTDLKGRPVFVRTREHIEAHFLTCFIALTLVRMLEVALKHKYSSRKILDGINSAVVTELAKGIFSVNRRDPIINELDKMLDVDFSCRYVKKEDLRKYHSKILRAVYTTSKN